MKRPNQESVIVLGGRARLATNSFLADSRVRREPPPPNFPLQMRAYATTPTGLRPEMKGNLCPNRCRSFTFI